MEFSYFWRLLDKRNLRSMKTNEITKIVIGKAIEVHRELGPGLLESTYAECLCYELEETDLTFIPELIQPVIY
ncbi:MAG: hypothetical protein DHS20C18_24810 [Saprospiraceae bacterium]|nr:MAG: hypothetical protein DHS20C18_24810 [Saprospiraceae bacterium]